MGRSLRNLWAETVFCTYHSSNLNDSEQDGTHHRNLYLKSNIYTSLKNVYVCIDDSYLNVSYKFIWVMFIYFGLRIRKRPYCGITKTDLPDRSFLTLVFFSVMC